MILPVRRGGWSDRKLRKRVLRGKPVALEDAPEGVEVYVRGVVRELEPLVIAPLSQAACVYHVSRVALSIGSRLAWREHAEIARGVPFVLESPGGRALVEPAEAEVALQFGTLTRSAAAFDADAVQRTLLAIKPIDTWFEIDSVHYYEGVIAPGQPLALAGVATRELDPDASQGGYRDAPTRLRFRGPLALCTV